MKPEIQLIRNENNEITGIEIIEQIEEEDYEHFSIVKYFEIIEEIVVHPYVNYYCDFFFKGVYTITVRFKKFP